MASEHDIIVVDDHPLFRRGVIQLLKMDPSFNVVAEAGDFEAAMVAVRERDPDIVLLDLNMKHTSGVEILTAIKTFDPSIRVIMLTVSDSPSDLLQCFQNGADGYLLKTADEDEFLVAIRALLKGRKYISTELTGSMIISYVDGNAEAASKADSLTPKEKMVLKLIAEGNSNKDIAAKLNLSVKTIDTHRTSFMKKLDLHNVREVTRFAMQNGLVGDGID